MDTFTPEWSHIVSEFSFGVSHISLNNLGLQLTLLEGSRWTVIFSGGGFCLARDQTDGDQTEDMYLKDNIYSKDSPLRGDNTRVFESMDSLLSTISPLYRDAFSNSLASKLEAMGREMGDSEDDV